MFLVLFALPAGCRAVEGPVFQVRPDAGSEPAPSEWSVLLRTDLRDRLEGVVRDRTGRLYAALGGGAELTISAAEGPDLDERGPGAHGVFLLSLEPDGTILWVREYTGDDLVDVRSLEVTEGGTTIVGGQVAGDVQLGDTTCAAGSSQDATVWVHDREGDLAWARCFGSNRNYQVHGTASTGEEVWSTGLYWSTTPFTAEAVSLPATTVDDGFVLRHDGTTGALEAGFPLSASGFLLLQSIVLLPERRIALGGIFEGTLDTPPAPTSAGESDAFVLFTSEEGVPETLLQAEGTGDTQGGVLIEAGDGLAWVFAATERTRLGEVSIETAGGGDFIVVRLDIDGTVRWARAFGGPSQDSARSLAFDEGTRTLLVSGAFAGRWTTEPRLAATQGSDGFVMSLDWETGAPIDWRTLAGTGDVDVWSATPVAEGLVVGGTFTGELRLAGRNFVSSGEGDAFIARLAFP